MNKNVLVITGSPRKGGNSDLMAEAFIKGANQAGNMVTKIEAAALKISPCKACRGCFKNEKPCVTGDDFNKVAPLVEEAEVIVFATPLYWYSFPTQLKLVIDKFNSLLVGQKNLENKESILMVCGADELDRQYEGIHTTYDLIVDYLKWKNIGKITAKSIYEKGEIKNTDALMKAEELGKSII